MQPVASPMPSSTSGTGTTRQSCESVRIRTRTENTSRLQWDATVYDLFEYRRGRPSPLTLGATFHCRRLLALYHQLLENCASGWTPGSGSYHMAPRVERGL